MKECWVILLMLSTRVAAARASTRVLRAAPELINAPQAFAKFQAALTGLWGELSRLLAVSENYPQLKAGANLRGLQDAPSAAARN